MRNYNTMGSGRKWSYWALVPQLEVFTVDCLTHLTFFPCSPALSSSGVLFILVLCCTEVTGKLGLNPGWLAGKLLMARISTVILVVCLTAVEAFRSRSLNSDLSGCASLYSLVIDCLDDSVLNSTLTVVVRRDLACCLIMDVFLIFLWFQHSAAYGFSILSHSIFPIVCNFYITFVKFALINPCVHTRTQITQSYLLEQKSQKC